MRFRDFFTETSVLKEVLGSLGQTERILWYPSAGHDFRDVIEMSAQRRAIHGIDEEPNIYCHTDDRGRWIEEADGILHDDGRTCVELLTKQNLTLYPEQNEDKRTEVYLLRVRLLSDSIGVLEQSIFYFVMKNHEFLERVLLRHQLRVSHLVKVREGIGFGGGDGRSIALVYGVLGYLGVKYLIADTQARFDESEHEGIVRLLDGPNPAFTLSPSAESFEWSHMTCRPYRITPVEGALSTSAVRQIFAQVQQKL